MPFLGLTTNSLLQNPSIQRRPGTQRQWNGFIQELDKRLNGEQGAFTPIWTGFSSDPSNGICYWKKTGALVLLSMTMGGRGTSDATTFSITGIPTIIRPASGGTAVQYLLPIVGLVDNNIESWGTANVTSAGVVNFGYEGSAQTTWTASGSKGFDTSSSTRLTIIYDTQFTEGEV